MLEREQEEIDSQARALEKKLRLVMDGTNPSKYNFTPEKGQICPNLPSMP